MSILVWYASCSFQWRMLTKKITMLRWISMGAYDSRQYSAYEAWKQVVRKRQKIILSPQYREAMHDECMMALMFGFTAPLLDKILRYSLPSEYEFVMDLFSDDIEITISNGNLVISNWRKTIEPVPSLRRWKQCLSVAVKTRKAQKINKMGVPKIKTKDVVETLRGILVKTLRRNSHLQDSWIILIRGLAPGLCIHRTCLSLKICYFLLQSSYGIIV